MITMLRSVRPPDPTRRRRRWPANPALFSGTIFRLRPRVEWMEARTLLSTFLVSNTDDGGAGSLRQAILDSDATPGGTNTIDFEIPGSGQQTIGVVSPLPAATTSLIIDGTTQPGYSGSPMIAVAGEEYGSLNPLPIGSDVAIRGLAIPGYTFPSESAPSTLSLESVPFPGPEGGIVTTRIVTSAGEDLTAAVQAAGDSTSLSLLDAQGGVLQQSAGGATTGPAAAINTFIPAGTYSLQVQGEGGGPSFSLTAIMTPSDPPFQPVPVGNDPDAVAAGDFAGDGKLDLAVANSGDGDVSILMGNGDGTFQPPVYYKVGNGPVAIVAGDFAGDGKIDLAVVNGGSSNISILMGNGDGTFQPAVNDKAGIAPDAITAGYFSGDGELDLAVANKSGAVSILMGKGDGRFGPPVTYKVGAAPDAIVAGAFSGDGKVDLAVVNGGTSNVSILMGNGDGTFRPAVNYAAGPFPVAIAAGDFAGDGKVDLAVVNEGGNDVSILRGNGDGTFKAPVNYAVGVQSVAIVAGDFDGGSVLDLVVVSLDGDDITILTGNGDGTFQDGATIPVGSEPNAIVTGDFNGDGRLDMAVTDSGLNAVSILLGNGNGNLLGQTTFSTSGILAMAPAYFNADGNLDLAVADAGTDSISILLGNGDGTFQAGVAVTLDSQPTAIVAGDFNNDGRTDLAALDALDNDVLILLGNGDGTFQPPVAYPVGKSPSAITTGYFSGDGDLDIAVADSSGNEVSILMGNGDGTFRPAVTVPVGEFPGAIVAAEFSGNGKVDLAVANEGSDTISILMGNGDGTFQPAVNYAVGPQPGLQPEALVAGDFGGDGELDLAIANYVGNVSILMGNGDGTFRPAVEYPVGTHPIAIVEGDFSGDGKLDLAVANDYNGDVSILMGNGDGTFGPSEDDDLGGTLDALVVGDFSGVGTSDLDLVSVTDASLFIQTREANGTFSLPTQADSPPLGNPVVTDVNGDGTDDVLVVDESGTILYRQGIPGQPGSFEPPVTVNPGHPSRDIAWVPDTLYGPVLASVDALDDFVSLYAYRKGAFTLVGSLATGQLPAQLIAADLDGTGLDDLIVRNAGSNTLTVFMNNGLGSFWTGFDDAFLPAVTIAVGLGASEVQAVDTSDDGLLDLVVTNELTGEVSVLHNEGDGQFATPVSYRAGTGLMEIDPGGTPEVSGLDVTAGLAAGPLVPGGPVDLVTINPGTSTFDVLMGLGDGRFSDPVTLQNPSPAHFIRLADFTVNSIPDLAVLTVTGLVIYLGNGQGGFLPGQTYQVPASSDGLTVADVSGNGKLDIVVGDAYGDVLILMGNGDGTFQPYRAVDQAIELAVADLTGDGSPDFIFANQGLDRVTVQYGTGSSPSVVADQSQGLLEPGAVTLADLNDDGIPDLVVADSGGNNVLIYPGLGNGQFGPAINDGYGYFVGTNPVGITVADLTGGLPDLVVADEGSNQVSTLLNTSLPGGPISFQLGQRLSSGGSGPVSTVVGTFSGNVYPDIMVTNSGSNDVTMLKGVQPGFFSDLDPRDFPVGTAPANSFVANFDGRPDLVTVNAGSDDLTMTSGFEGANPVVSTLSSGGVDPTTAFTFSTGGGFSDLVVGNSGDGALSLFEGGPEGLEMASVQEEPGLPDPTALAFSTLTGGAVDFYAATAGRESADLVALSLSIPDETSESGSGTSQSSAQLVALNDSALPLVATVLTLTLEVSGEEAVGGASEGEALGTVASPAGPGTSAGQGPFSTARGGGSSTVLTEGSDEPGATGAVVPAALLPWERFVLGLDEALEGLEPEGEVLAPPGPMGGPDGSPAPDPPAQGGGTGLRSVPARPVGVETEDRDASMSARRTGATVAEMPRVQESRRLDSDRPIPAEVIDAAIARIDDPRRGDSERRTRTEAIDAAIARIGADRAGDDWRVIDHPAHRPGKDEACPSSLCLAVTLLAARWGALVGATGRPIVVNRPSVSPFRCRPRLTI